MKSLEQLWSAVAENYATICHVSTKRDSLTLSRRVEHEGISFLTITLPTFAKSLELGLEQGKVSDDLFPGFHRVGGLPAFLQGFLRKVFDSCGNLLPEPDVECIRAIRQLCYLFQKIELDCTQARKSKAVSEFWQSNDECRAWDSSHQPILDRLRVAAHKYLGSVLSAVNREVADGLLEPKHGPGKTASGEKGNQKFDFLYWPPRLEQEFSWTEWGTPNFRWSFADEHLELVNPPRFEEVPAKLTLVPKTLKSPRVIVQEPAAHMYMQQALLRSLVRHLEANTSCIGFSSQELNRAMACLGSESGLLATLDLSEASDRVTFSQVRAVFSDWPDLWSALESTRSIEVSDGQRTGFIYRFASMGSAVCFPVEAIVFFLATCVAMEDARGLAKLPRSAREGLVRVYGDDIIVPVDSISAVRTVFQSLGWKINGSKSFWTGKFRESCGGDYYDGQEVTPVRLRRLIPTRRQQASNVISIVSFRNQLYQAGLWSATRWVDNIIEGLIPFPIVGSHSDALGRHSSSFVPLQQGTDGMHRVMVRAMVVHAPLPRSEASERGSLLKCLLSSHEEVDHLTRAGRPSVVDIKRRWVAAL